MSGRWSGSWDQDGADRRRALGTSAPEAGAAPTPLGRGHPQAGEGFPREADPVNVYPFIEAGSAAAQHVASGLLAAVL
jgi:hypothetical protein